MSLKEDEKKFLVKVQIPHGYAEIIKSSNYQFSDLKEIILPNTRSLIIEKSKNKLYVFSATSLGGLFIKEQEDTLMFGRIMCDFVKFKHQNFGFFTTDELPRYGINRATKRQIIKLLEINPKQDLGFMLAYDLNEAKAVKNTIIQMFKSLSNSISDFEASLPDLSVASGYKVPESIERFFAK